MSPALSRRIGAALGAHFCTIAERQQVTAAMDSVETWDELPAGIKTLVEQIEARPGLGDQ